MDFEKYLKKFFDSTSKEKKHLKQIQEEAVKRFRIETRKVKNENGEEVIRAFHVVLGERLEEVTPENFNSVLTEVALEQNNFIKDYLDKNRQSYVGLNMTML